MVVNGKINIQESRIKQKSNKTMSVMLCKGATFRKNSSCLVARIL